MSLRPRQPTVLLAALLGGCAALPSGEPAAQPVPLALSAGAEPPAASGVEAPDGEDTGDEDPGDEAGPTGPRAWLEEQGVVVELSAYADAATVVGGGVRQRSTTQALFDVGVGADLGTLAGWDGATLWAEWWTRPGRTLNDDVGDWQGTTWIDAPHQHQLYQLWLEAWLVPDALRIKLGKQEGFDEFAVVESAAEFLNNGPAYAPTLDAMPSYPDPAYAIAAFAYPAAGWWLSAAAFDGAGQEGVATGKHGASTFLGDPSDLFLVAEAGRAWERGEGAAPGRGGFGLWKHTGDFERFAGGEQDDALGWYALVEQQLWSESPGDAGDPQGLTAFAQLSAGDEDVLEVARHEAAGLQWIGALAGRDEDIAGLAVSRVVFSDEPGAAFDDHHETAVEAFYRWQATPWLAIKPDLQFIRHPAGDASIDDAFVATLRFEATF